MIKNSISVSWNYTCFSVITFFSQGYSLGEIDFSASLSGYDSRVFGVSSNMFNASRSGSNPNIPSHELESEDDFILKFYPVLE